MISMNINKNSMNNLFFDSIEMGKSQFILQEDQYTAKISEKELDEFMRENNLITYKNELKHYENGEIVGLLEFPD